MEFKKIIAKSTIHQNRCQWDKNELSSRFSIWFHENRPLQSLLRIVVMIVVLFGLCLTPFSGQLVHSQDVPEESPISNSTEEPDKNILSDDNSPGKDVSVPTDSPQEVDDHPSTTSLEPNPNLIHVQTESMEIVFSRINASIVSLKLINYSDPGEDGLPHNPDLVYPSNSSIKPMTVSFNKADKLEGIQVPFEYLAPTSTNPLEHAFVVEVSNKDRNPTKPYHYKMTKVYTLPKSGYLINVKIIIDNLTESEYLKNSVDQEDAGLFIYWGPSIGTFDRSNNPTGRSRYDEWLINYAKKGVDSIEYFTDIDDLEQPRKLTDVKFVGLNNRYFLIAMIPRKNIVWGDIYAKNYIQKGGELEEVSLIAQNQELIGLGSSNLKLKPMESKTFELDLYAGPKVREYLEEHGLERAIESDWWIIRILVRFIEWMLFGVNTYIGSFGLSIIIITIILKIVLYPLTYKSMKSTQKMQQLQPLITEINNKYKKDPQKKQQAMMELYKKEKINPLGGCLPLLLQLPIFIALFQALPNLIVLKNANFLWINDLSSPDTIWRFDFWSSELNILPLIMTVTSILQTILTPQTPAINEQAKQQQKIMQFMPLIFLFIFYSMPSGLVLYWTVQNLLQIIIQLITNIIKKSKEQSA